MNESIKIIDSDQVIKDLLWHFSAYQIIKSLIRVIGEDKITEYLEEVNYEAI